MRWSSLQRKTEKAQLLLKQLYRQPIVDAKKVAEVVGVSASTANRLIKDFVALNILSEQTDFKRNRKFIFRTYVDIFK